MPYYMYLCWQKKPISHTVTSHTRKLDLHYTNLSCSFQWLLAVEVVLTLSQGNHSVGLLVHLELDGSTYLHVWQQCFQFLFILTTVRTEPQTPKERKRYMYTCTLYYSSYIASISPSLSLSLSLSHLLRNIFLFASISFSSGSTPSSGRPYFSTYACHL